MCSLYYLVWCFVWSLHFVFLFEFLLGALVPSSSPKPCSLAEEDFLQRLYHAFFLIFLYISEVWASLCVQCKWKLKKLCRPSNEKKMDIILYSLTFPSVNNNPWDKWGACSGCGLLQTIEKDSCSAAAFIEINGLETVCMLWFDALIPIVTSS